MRISKYLLQSISRHLPPQSGIFYAGYLFFYRNLATKGNKTHKTLINNHSGNTPQFTMATKRSKMATFRHAGHQNSIKAVGFNELQGSFITRYPQSSLSCTLKIQAH